MKNVKTTTENTATIFAARFQVGSSFIASMGLNSAFAFSICAFSSSDNSEGVPFSHRIHLFESEVNWTFCDPSSKNFELIEIKINIIRMFTFIIRFLIGVRKFFGVYLMLHSFSWNQGPNFADFILFEEPFLPPFSLTHPKTLFRTILAPQIFSNTKKWWCTDDREPRELFFESKVQIV